MSASVEQHRGDSESFRGSDPDSIRAGINETRERISHDLDEIGDRLNPHNMKEDIKEGIREATIGRVEDMARQAGQKLSDTGSGIVQTIRDNPLPAAVAGVGIAWLLMSQGSNAGRNRGTRYQSGAEAEPGTMEKVKEKMGEVAGEAQQAVSDAAGPKMESARSAFEENPLAIAVGAMAVGIAVGLLAPSTRSESKVIGSVGDTVREKVTEVARDTSEKAQHVAERALDETKTAAREEGLTSNQPQSSTL